MDNTEPASKAKRTEKTATLEGGGTKGSASR